MIKTYLYLSEDLHQRITKASEKYNISKAEIMRQSMEEGFIKIYGEPDTTIKVVKTTARKLGRKPKTFIWK